MSVVCRLFIPCVLCFTMLALACRPGGDNIDDEDTLLAEVYGRKLWLSDVLPLILNRDTPEDSIAQVRTYVEQWVREELLLNEAAKHVPVDVNINKLVDDYRASLVISNYENVLVHTLLDTVVTEAQLNAYYEKNKDQYQLEMPIVRCHFVRFTRPVPNADLFQRLWQSEMSEDFQRLALFCQAQADMYMLDDSTWYKLQDIENLLPPGVLSAQNIRPGRSLRFSDNEYEYFLRITNRMLSTEIAPLSYIREQAVRYIMHKRKLELLESIKNELYQREIDGGNVIIR